MPAFDHGPARLHYDVEGDGYPVLVLAPGGMQSANELWNRAPWNPRTALVDSYSVIGMDQRNAGRSTAPVTAADDWSSYAGDQLALLDHLGIEQCHLLGMCIGGPFIAGLLATAPERFPSAVLLQPAGMADNGDAYFEMFWQWAAGHQPNHPEATPTDWTAFCANMWGGDFVFAATREQVAASTAPMLVMMGDDLYHPQAVSREFAALAPNATLVERWKDAASLPATHSTITEFLAAHTPTAP